MGTRAPASRRRLRLRRRRGSRWSPWLSPGFLLSHPRRRLESLSVLPWATASRRASPRGCRTRRTRAWAWTRTPEQPQPAPSSRTRGFRRRRLSRPSRLRPTPLYPPRRSSRAPGPSPRAPRPRPAPRPDRRGLHGAVRVPRAPPPSPPRLAADSPRIRRRASATPRRHPRRASALAFARLIPPARAARVASP